MYKWTVNEHNREDDAKIFTLQNLTYPDHPIYSNCDVAQRYWQWRYFSNPSIKSYIFVIKSIEGSSIAGMRPMSVIPMKVGDQTLNSLWLTAVITHSAYRKKGIFSTLVSHSMHKAKQLGVSFVYTFPNETSYAIYKKKEEWRYVGNIPIFARLGNMSSLVRNAVNKYFDFNKYSKSGKCFQKHCISSVDTRKWRFSAKINLAESIGVEYDEFWQRISKNIQIGIHRDSKYLRWRYLENPVFEYQILEAKDRYNKLVGYIILSMQCRKGLNVGLIVDIAIQENNEHITNDLIMESIHFLKYNNADLICCLITGNHILRKILFQNGFITIPRFIRGGGVHLVSCVFNDDANIKDYVYDIKRWYIAWGDTDNS